MFFYSDGREIYKGDRLCMLWGDRGIVHAIVKDIFHPGTEGAKDYSCVETGGVLLNEEEPKKAFGMLLAIPREGRLEEDYELVSRGEAV